MTKKTVEGRPKTGSLDPRIVPDAKWPGMYRIRRPHGSLSDMPNLTRIQRCPARNGSPHAGSADTEGSMSQEMAPLAARELRDRIVGLDRLLRPEPPPPASLALCRRHGLLQDGLSRCRFPRYSLARA